MRFQEAQIAAPQLQSCLSPFDERPSMVWFTTTGDPATTPMISRGSGWCPALCPASVPSGQEAAAALGLQSAAKANANLALLVGTTGKLPPKPAV